MKRIIGVLIFSWAFWAAGTAQNHARFTVEISSDSILMDNYFLVTFTLENANGSNFQPPVFEGFDVISGPDLSSSVSMINGEVTQKVSYTFYLKPREIGNYYIQPASIQTNGTVLESTPLEVIVVPNPDGIIRQPQQRNRSDFFRFPFDDFDPMPFFAPRMPQDTPPLQEEKKEIPGKKKRKVYKM